ncbi:MAG: chemotaxis protein CheX [Planctomycetota bacterium]
MTDAIDASLRETFAMMVGDEVEFVQKTTLDPSLRSPLTTVDLDNAVDRQMTVVVGLSGDLQGSVSVCLDQAAALDWTEKLIDHQTEQVDQIVVDAIGELGNMTVGGAKSRVDGFSLKLGLPSVLLTGHQHLAFPTQCRPIEMQYRYQSWDLRVFVALV